MRSKLAARGGRPNFASLGGLPSNTDQVVAAGYGPHRHLVSCVQVASAWESGQVTDAGFELHAWGDESMRTVGVQEPAYLLGAVVADPVACEAYRAELRSLKPAGRKLHWRDLDGRQRRRAVDVIASFDACHVVVIGAPLEAKKQERARAFCLQRLAWQLGENGVTQLMLEARPPQLNKRDMQTIDSLRGRGGLPASLRIDHGQPSEEPMLWVPDQVVGAVAESLAGDHSFRSRLESSIEITHITT